MGTQIGGVDFFALEPRFIKFGACHWQSIENPFILSDAEGLPLSLKAFAACASIASSGDKDFGRPLHSFCDGASAAIVVDRCLTVKTDHKKLALSDEVFIPVAFIDFGKPGVCS